MSIIKNFCCATYLLSVSMAGAATTWTGTTSSAWGNAANWTSGLPGVGNDPYFIAPTTTPVATGNNNAFSVTNLQLDWGGSLTIGAGTGSLSVTGTTLVKQNATLTKSGNATFSTASVHIEGGTFTPFNALVLSGRLSGAGTVGAGVTINGGATHSPGGTRSDVNLPYSNGVGTQNVIGSLTYNSGSVFAWDLTAGPLDPGSNTPDSGSYDTVTATSVAGSGGVFQILLDSGSFNDAFWNTNKSWSNIFTGATNLATVFTSFGGTVPSNGVVANRGTFSFSGSTLNFSAVPEPGTALAGVLLGAGLMRRRRM